MICAKNCEKLSKFVEVMAKILSVHFFWVTVYRVFQKKKPHKTFRNIFTLVKSFCVKFCKFVGNSYPHTSTNFCRFVLIFH